MDMGMDMGGGTGCQMSMLWSWNVIDSCFLASSWHIKSHGAFAASCIGVALLAICLELFRRLGREYDDLISRQYTAASRHQPAWRLTKMSATTAKAKAAAVAAATASSKATSVKSANSSEDGINTLAARDACCAVPSCSNEQPATRDIDDDAMSAAESQPSSASPRTFTYRVTPLQQLVRAVLHGITIGLAYILMLIAMEFNGYMIISIILGSGIGKFLCDWMVVRVTVGADGDVLLSSAKKAGGMGDEMAVCCG